MDKSDDIIFPQFPNCRMTIHTPDGVITVENVSLSLRMENEFVRDQGMDGRRFEALVSSEVVGEFRASPQDITFPGRTEKPVIKEVSKIRRIRADLAGDKKE